MGKGLVVIVYRVKWLGVYVVEKKFYFGYFFYFNVEVLMLVKFFYFNIVLLLCYMERGSEYFMVIELMDKNFIELIEERLKFENICFLFFIDELVDIIF